MYAVAAAGVAKETGAARRVALGVWLITFF
jgi:hypothetical protein